MGKSVLLATLALQFRRYFGSRIFAFDMGRSMRATILGLGGEHYDLGADGGIAFQPLARIDHEGYRTWAAEWVEGRLSHEGIAIGPDERWPSGRRSAASPVRREQRTMTGLSVLLQSNALQALSPYVLGGAHGSCWTQTPTALAPVPCRASRWKNDAQPRRGAGGAALPVRPLR